MRSNLNDSKQNIDDVTLFVTLPTAIYIGTEHLPFPENYSHHPNILLLSIESFLIEMIRGSGKAFFVMP